MADQPTREQVLEGALRSLVRGYVNVLENGRDRILYLGGQCDPLDKMEASDPNLREARNALAYGVQEVDPRCKGCDLPNGCPEYCWCDEAGAGKAEYASWFPISPRGVDSVDGGQQR